MTIYFDMDGTLVDFYGVDGWLDDLTAKNTRPYDIAEPRFSFAQFAKMCHKMQNHGYKIGIISWLSKCGDAEFDEAVTNSKLSYLKKHLPSVEFDEIHIVPYGTPKSSVAQDVGYLFDDEMPNRVEWGFETSFGVEKILETLKIFS